MYFAIDFGSTFRLDLNRPFPAHLPYSPYFYRFFSVSHIHLHILGLHLLHTGSRVPLGLQFFVGKLKLV